jgi:membrane-associated phospholipid phosphatase
MKFLLGLLQQKAFYFIFFLSALGAAGIPVCCYNKIDCFILLNQVHAKWLDIFFATITFLGDGIFIIAVALSLLFIKKLRPLSLYITTAYLLSGVAVQLFKKLYNAPRPREIINFRVHSFFITGVTGAGWDSFPSGHTTSVFALATMLALHVNKKRWDAYVLITAILVGYSRIYLGQHFPEDVIAGSILGTAAALMVYLVGNVLKERKYKTTISPSAGNDLYSPGLQAINSN